MNDTATTLLYRMAWTAASHVPYSASRVMIDRACDVIVNRGGPSVRQLARNQRRVLGPDADRERLAATVRAAMRSYGRYWLETFRLHRADTDAVARRALAGSTGLHHIRAALEQHRGVILALPHSGNWDIAGLSQVALFGQITTVAERLQPPSLYEQFLSHRERLGFEILPLTGDGTTPTHTAAVLTERLTQGKMVCLLADRDLAGNGVPVTFFGEPTTMPPGPALLAARTGAALCPVHLSYSDHGWIQRVGAPLDLAGERLVERVHSGTQALAHFFERHIASAPADWHMLQPLWTADRARREVEA